MWNWLGKVVEPVVGAVSTYASEKNEIKKAKLDGEIEAVKAEAEFRVAQWKSKAAREATIDKGTFDLDKMAVAEAAKTWWDEGLVLLYLSPFIYQLFYAFFSGLIMGTGGLVDPQVLWDGINNLADWYKWGLLLVGVRYLGFRNLLRKGIELYSKKKGL